MHDLVERANFRHPVAFELAVRGVPADIAGNGGCRLDHIPKRSPLSRWSSQFINHLGLPPARRRCNVAADNGVGRDPKVALASAGRQQRRASAITQRRSRWPPTDGGRATAVTFEDFTVGEIYEHRPGRTISEADQYLVYAAHHEPTSPCISTPTTRPSRIRRPALVNSCLTLSIVVGMSASRDVSQKAVANLGWTDIKLTAPVFIGDTIYAESEVLSSAHRQVARRKASSRCARPARRPTAPCS